MATEAGLAAVLGRVNGDRLRALTVAVVDAYSPTYAEESATAVFAHYLEAAGLKVTRQVVANPHGAAPRHNLLVRVGPEPLGLLLVGHVDTIASGEGAMAFCGGHVDDDLLTGLGSADMKGGCAAAVEAILALAASGIALQRGVGLALVVGEEEYGDGSAALPGEFSAPLCLVGEPTSLEPCISHFGYAECHLTATGTRAHAALSGGGGSAIHAMLTWLLAVLDGMPGSDPAGIIAANARLIRGGDTLFVVADSCDALLDLHWAPGVEAADVLRRIERSREAAQWGHPGCQLASETLFQAAAFANDGDDPRLASLRAAFQQQQRAWQPGVFPSHSDAGLFTDRGSLTVVCGPGALSSAHAPGESVFLSEVEAAARLYAAVAVLACGA
jgi:acetylornithine deacetylase